MGTSRSHSPPLQKTVDMKAIVEFFEQTFATPKAKLFLGMAVGTVGVIAATYALMKIKGIEGGALDGIKIGAGCPHCRMFWTGVGAGVIGIVWGIYLISSQE